MNELDFGGDGSQILTHFRSVAKSYAELFYAQRNHVEELLHGAHSYSSGVFRESLIRNFLSTVLPASIGVDSGFVYGFEQAENSRQIDVLVWDSLHHAAVYRTDEFVILPPEAVIAAISVKSALRKRDLEDSLENLLSLTPLELMYRSTIDAESGEPIFRPITKIVLSYKAPKNPRRALATAGDFFTHRLATNGQLAEEMIEAFKHFNPVQPLRVHRHRVERIVPKLVAAIEGDAFSLFQGWGPPEDKSAQRLHGPWELRRLPYMYPQQNKLTTPLEKVVYYVLAAVYATLGTDGWSLVSAWGEFNPATGVRVGDASEVIEAEGVRLLDPDKLATEHSPGVS